jgi:AcrR family transcriptional regulator
MPPTPTPRSHTPKGRRARARILAAAERLLAVRGFHGTSVRDVAAAARLPLASVVYHFARKEQLYAAVLEAIGGELHRAIVAAGAGAGAAEAGPLARADAFARALVRWSLGNPGRVRLLLRELLDNPARVARASRLPLAPVLTEAAALVGATGATGAAPAVPELAVLHVVGAVSYVVAAQPTVARIVGPARAARLAAASEREAIACARRVLGLPATIDPGKETPDAERPPGRARPARARAPRAEDDGRRARAVDDPGGGVHRPGAPRARARAPVP